MSDNHHLYFNYYTHIMSLIFYLILDLSYRHIFYFHEIINLTHFYYYSKEGIKIVIIMELALKNVNVFLIILFNFLIFLINFYHHQYFLFEERNQF